jgi:hypothetical protein
MSYDTARDHKHGSLKIAMVSGGKGREHEIFNLCFFVSFKQLPRPDKHPIFLRKRRRIHRDTRVRLSGGNDTAESDFVVSGVVDVIFMSPPTLDP